MNQKSVSAQWASPAMTSTSPETTQTSSTASYDAALTCSGTVAVLAIITTLLSNHTPTTQQQPTTQATAGADSTIGYALILIGYLLLLCVGILLMRRKRAVSQTRTAVLSGVGDAVDADETPFTPSCSSVTSLLRGRGTARRIDAVTECVQWQGDDVQCAVCLSDVSKGCTARVLPCRHAFHKECADLWLVTGQKNCCPLCMRSVCQEESS